MNKNTLKLLFKYIKANEFNAYTVNELKKRWEPNENLLVCFFNIKEDNLKEEISLNNYKILEIDKDIFDFTELENETSKLIADEKDEFIPFFVAQTEIDNLDLKMLGIINSIDKKAIIVTNHNLISIDDFIKVISIPLRNFLKNRGNNENFETIKSNIRPDNITDILKFAKESNTFITDIDIYQWENNKDEMICFYIDEEIKDFKVFVLDKSLNIEKILNTYKDEELYILSLKTELPDYNNLELTFHYVISQKDKSLLIMVSNVLLPHIALEKAKSAYENFIKKGAIK